MQILKVIGLLMEYPDELLWECKEDALALIRRRSSVRTSEAGVKEGKSTCQWRSLPPSSFSFSRRSTPAPCSASRSAVCMPATPPPMTIIRFFIAIRSIVFESSAYSRMS